MHRQKNILYIWSDLFLNSTAYERRNFVRDPKRGNAYDYISNIFEYYYEMRRDRCFGEDKAITGGFKSLKKLKKSLWRICD